jgi:hypothetical protein
MAGSLRWIGHRTVIGPIGGSRADSRDRTVCEIAISTSSTMIMAEAYRISSDAILSVCTLLGGCGS